MYLRDEKTSWIRELGALVNGKDKAAIAPGKKKKEVSMRF